MWIYGLDWAGPGQRQVVDACECGNEPSGSVKCGEFLDQLQTSQLLKQHSAACSQQYIEQRTIKCLKIIPAWARFSARPDRSWGPPILLYNEYRVFPGRKERPGCDADPSPLLVPWSRKNRTVPLFPLWAVRPVQSLSACIRAHFNFYFTRTVKI